MENRRLRNELNEAQYVNKVLLDRQGRGEDDDSEYESADENLDDLEDDFESDAESNCSPPHSDYKTPPRMIYSHLVVCKNGGWNYFRDRPMLFRGDFRKAHLRGRSGIDLQSLLQQPSDIAFAVIKRYECSCGDGPTDHHIVGYENGRLTGDAPAPASTSEHVWVHSSLLNALRAIIGANPHKFQGFASEGYSGRFFAPYLLFYIHNRTFSTFVASGTLEPKATGALKLLCTWFEQHWRKDWSEADEEFSRGKTTLKHYPLLFRPGELIRCPARDEFNIYRRDNREESIQIEKVQQYPWQKGDESVDVFFWQFNGSFHMNKFWVNITWESCSHGWDGEKDIVSLRFSPLRFWGPDYSRKLVLRGHQFWRCRHKRLIAYLENRGQDGDVERVRQMVPTHFGFRQTSI